MTPSRASLIELLDRYLVHSLGITMIDVQKLMYFLQEAGEPLKLRYSKGLYGPYADQLRHVLNPMEGHYISGLGDGSSKATDVLPIELSGRAVVEAQGVLSGRPDTAERLNRVAHLIEGFESTYGLELLATVHWAATKELERSSGPALLRLVQSWNKRKGKLFTDRHVRAAADHLESLGWVRTPLTWA